jgi:hypothetical protein
VSVSASGSNGMKRHGVHGVSAHVRLYLGFTATPDSVRYRYNPPIFSRCNLDCAERHTRSGRMHARAGNVLGTPRMSVRRMLVGGQGVRENTLLAHQLTDRPCSGAISETRRQSERPTAFLATLTVLRISRIER